MRRWLTITAAGGRGSARVSRARLGVPPSRRADDRRTSHAWLRAAHNAARRDAGQGTRDACATYSRVARAAGPLLVAFAFILLAGCRRDMADQARYDRLEANSFFADGAASRPIPAHTIAQGQLRADALFYTGHTGNGQLAAVFPHPIVRADLERGRQRYDIFCAPCHGRVGDGQGMIVQRGFPPPPTFHQPRLRDAPPGHFFEVMTHGYGVMYPYASRIPVEDRWAIASYIRALQLSQNARLADAPTGAMPP